MDESTEGVTLYAGFIFDLLDCFPGAEKTFAKDLYAMAEDLDPEQPTASVPFELYNRMCGWIEQRLGPATLRKAGSKIGERAYGQMLEVQGMPERPGPTRILEGLKHAADAMIQDPKGRGWTIVESADDRMLMRRTLSFNCILQEGLLQSLVTRTGVSLPRVRHARCTRRGDEFCEYEVTWLSS